MVINTILETFTQAVKTDTALRDWCRVNYDNRDLSVFENIDLRQPPGETSCPLVAFFAESKQGGGTQKVGGIGVLCLVLDDETPQDVHGVKRFTGGRHVETLRQMVVACLSDAVPDNILIDSIDTEYDPIEQFPYVSASMRVVLTEGWTIGSDHLE